MVSPDWFKWGWYVTTIVESNSRWDVVESDFLIPQDRLYGGGIGIIQFTSQNFELLRRIVKHGYDMSNFPDGAIKSDLINGVKTVNWFKSSLSSGGGLFTLNETLEIKNMLSSDLGKESQAYYNEVYFKTNNKAYYNNIMKSNLDDECKAFLVNIIVLRPASVNALINTNPSNIDELLVNTLAIPQLSGYGTRMNRVVSELKQADFSSSPPIDIDNIADMNDPEPRPDPPEVVAPIEKEVMELDESLMNNVSKLLTNDIYFYGNDKTIGNSNIVITKVMGNMYKVKLTGIFANIINSILEDNKDKLDEVVDEEIEVYPPTNPNIPDPEPITEKFFPVDITRQGINFWQPPYDMSTSLGVLKHNMDYGERTGGRWHNGYDIGGGGINHKVYAVRSGIVTRIGVVSGYGYSIQIKHNDDEYYSYYAHLVSNSATINQGDEVEGGQHIATMGNTGGNYSIHLHIEISTTDKIPDRDNSINPRTYLEVNDDNKTKLSNPTG